MNKKGQAIVEFVIILPILILLIFSFVDFGRIIICKSHLESVMDSIKDIDENEIPSYLQNDKEYKINYEIKKDKYLVIKLKTNLSLITPGLKNVLSNPYTVSVERSLLYE